MITRLMLATALALAAVAAALAQGAPPQPDLDALLRAATYEIAFDGGKLSGPGAEVIDRATANSQFVLVGESHFDHDTPLFAGALFHMLEADRGFHHYVVEQDGVGMEDILRPGVRGDVHAIAEVAKRHPTLIGFASDQDLELLADVGAREKGPSPIWGLEQVQGAARYLEELDKSANPEARAQITALLAEARKYDTRETLAHFLAEDRTTMGRLQALEAVYHAKPGSRAEDMLDGLIKSAEIYSYYFRAEAGEPVGLFNNTVRESWLKARFMRRYRAEARDGRPIKAMFKFGDTHMIHGLDEVMAFPIGNFAHEFAISNGMDAYSIDVAPAGDYAKLSDHPIQFRVFYPKQDPTKPILIDLRALRPYQRFFRAKIPVEEQWRFRQLVNGYDAIVVLPNSRKADMKLTGFPWTGGN